MKRLLASPTVAGALAAGVAGQALADGEDHNCAGAVSSGVAQALGSTFGTIVSGAAQQQMVDNFGFANCGESNGSNP